KGLKKSTFISYTVFVAKKAFNKTGLTKKSIMHEKILIQGEPTLDIPIDECPGEVGVICFQITVLPNKNDKENESDAKKESKQEASAPSQSQKNTEPTKQEEDQAPVSQPVAKEEKKEAETVQTEAKETKETPVQEKKAEPKPKTLPNQPKGTQDLLSFDDIIVPEAFLNTRPNPEKTQKVIDYVKRTGRLDEPLTIEKGSKVLKDGYRRYVVAKTVKMEKVPVVYEYQK
ncbi:plasmid stabilization protein, partial [Priestia megaterium]|uniref:plasmid stabilization protein n=2 Tax=Bacillaceae TaxID=186817 RepID=UPI0030CD9DE9